jgi:hypothetical protein
MSCAEQKTSRLCILHRRTAILPNILHLQIATLCAICKKKKVFVWTVKIVVFCALTAGRLRLVYAPRPFAHVVFSRLVLSWCSKNNNANLYKFMIHEIHILYMNIFKQRQVFLHALFRNLMQFNFYDGGPVNFFHNSCIFGLSYSFPPIL